MTGPAFITLFMKMIKEFISGEQAMNYQTILVEKKDGIAKITLNIPEKLNPLNRKMREELADVLIGFQTDKTVKVVVITGAGRAFCAGGDINEMIGVTAPQERDRLLEYRRVVKSMVELEKPIIAAVNGPATGAGFHLALASDLIIASEKAKFAESFVRIGLVPDMGGFYFLPLRIGMHKAKELMFTGRLFDAREAEQMGLLNKCVPHEALDAEVMELAGTLARGPGRSYAMIKAALNNLPASLQHVMEIEANMQAVCFETRDFKEGVRAFVEKRTPEFSGE
jgi:2-(1,2-epoxy-1,2-dihydrophenyl)acetyl-CoA isomerase